MSSEMRECPFCGGEAERIDFGPGSGDNEGGSCVACTRCQASGPVEFGYKENFISNWNRRALLARTEAGADGAVYQWRDNFGGWRDCTESQWAGHTGKDRRVLYTHPQDASVDAEDAAMFRWLSDNARPWESDYEEPHALIRICRGEFQGGIGWFNIIGRESRVGIITLRDAVRAAMQAKEAK